MVLAWALCPPGFSTRAGDRFWLAQRYRSQAAGKAGFVAWDEGAAGRDPELHGGAAGADGSQLVPGPRSLGGRRAGRIPRGAEEIAGIPPAAPRSRSRRVGGARQRSAGSFPAVPGESSPNPSISALATPRQRLGAQRHRVFCSCRLPRPARPPACWSLAQAMRIHSAPGKAS